MGNPITPVWDETTDYYAHPDWSESANAVRLADHQQYRRSNLIVL